MLKLLDRMEEVVISFLIAAATLIIFVAVAHRYGIGGLASLVAWSRAHDLPDVASAARAGYQALAPRSD